MNFEDKSFEAILQEMLTSIPDQIDKSEGSPVYNGLAPAAVKLSEAYVAIDQILKLMFVQTTGGEWLDLKVAGENITRYKATPSIRHFETTGTGIIERHSRFFVDGIYFTAQERVAIPGVFRAESEESGRATAIFNPRTILPLENVAGLESITMVHHHELDVDGVDTETDDALRNRFWEKVRYSPGPGTNSDYIRWAKEIQGVGEVKVNSLWQGPNTVLLIILNLEGREAPPYLIEAVQNHIDPDQQGIGAGAAPVGAKVTVSTATTQSFEITIKGLVVHEDAIGTHGSIEKSFREFFGRIDVGGLIRMRAIESALIQTDGVVDFGDVMVDGRRENIQLQTDQLASLGKVIYDE